jgi:hypothetical protein
VGVIAEERAHEAHTSTPAAEGKGFTSDGEPTLDVRRRVRRCHAVDEGRTESNGGDDGRYASVRVRRAQDGDWPQDSGWTQEVG